MINIEDVDIDKLDSSIKMLKEYLNEPAIEPLINALVALRNDPHNELLVAQLSDIFKDLGLKQGAVLTYAPYVSILSLVDPFENISEHTPK